MQEAEAPRAYTSIQAAQELAQEGFVTEKEADLIAAMALRYHEPYDPQTQAVRDTAYAKAMEQLARKYPNDLDIGTFYAEALFLLEPRRGYRDIDDPDDSRIARINRQQQATLCLRNQAFRPRFVRGLAQEGANFIALARLQQTVPLASLPMPQGIPEMQHWLQSQSLLTAAAEASSSEGQAT